MIRRFASFAALAAALSIAGQAHAVYTVTLTNLSPTAGQTQTIGASTFVFVIPSASQPSAGDFAQPFNVINVAEPTASGSGSGFTTLSENFSISGNNPANTGTTTGTLTGTFTVTGALSTYNGSITNLVTTGGTGFGVDSVTYTQPTAGSANGSPTSGNVSIVVTPLSSVPEPASVAMLGLGLAGVAAYGLRRRSAK